MTVQSYQNGSISPVPTTEPSKLNTIVAEIGKMGFTGNVIPHAWYHHLKLSSGHTDLIGATLLADIVYQYRPGVVRDEATGGPLHMFKRFARDKFCAPIAYFEKKFGLTKDQIRQGLKRLEEEGYIRREYRDIDVAGQWVRGMTFIEPVPERIRAITPPPRPDARPAPGAIQRPKAAAVKQSNAVAASKDEGSVQEGAVSAPGCAVQIPPYKNTAEISKRTTTTLPTLPSSRNTSSSSWSSEQQTSKNTSASDIPPSAPVPATPALSQAVPPTIAATEADTPRPAPSPAVSVVTPPTETPTTTVDCLTQPAKSPQASPLLFDFHLAALDKAQQAELYRRLTRLPGPLAQAVLDEYNHAVGRNAQIRSKWGWIEFLIRAALDGRFIPTSDLAERRAALAQANATPAPVPATSPPPPQPSIVWKQQCATVEALFTPGEALVNVSPLRGVEAGQVLWLEAPNPFVVDWIRARLSQIEAVLSPHTALPIRVRLG